VSGGFCRLHSCKVHWDRLEIADQDGCDKQNPKIRSFFVPRILKSSMLNMDRSGVPEYPKIVCYHFAPCWSILHRDTTSRMITLTLESESRTRNT
jgi:hypothetical protein